MTSVVLGADVSTTAVKVLAFDRGGAVVAEGRAPLTLHNPAPEAWEQDAAEYRSAFAVAARHCAASLDERRIDGLAVTHQRETFVLTDANAEPRRRAVTWMDGRGSAAVTRIAGELGADALRARTGKEPCITPSLYKLAALHERDPDARSLFVHDVGGLFVAWLTGERATSLGSADPLGLVDLARGAWADDVLRVLGVPVDRLARLVPPGARVGAVTREAAAWSGLPEGLAVFAALGDGQCAGLGAGLTEPGRAYLNLGTALVGGTLSRTLVTDRAFRTLYGGIPGTFFLETDLKGGMFSVAWWVERMLGRTLDDVLPEAMRVPSGADGLTFVPHLLGVMNPHWDDDARGAILGLAAHHGPGHVLRAIVEGLAMEQRVHFDGVEAAVGPLSEIVLLGGGIKNPVLREALLGAFEARLVASATAEATALGAAMLAAAGAGWFDDVEGAVRAMSAGTTEVARGGEARLPVARFAKAYAALAALRA